MKTLTAFLLGLMSVLALNAQTEKCRTHTRWQELAEKDPEAIARKQALEEFTQQYTREADASRRATVTVPVVVHVLYNNSTQNISAAQVQSQIDVLNKDFRKTNSDALPSSHAFGSIAADTEIEFCLASEDPNGNATDGINRVQTSESSFNDNSDDMKSSATGGTEGWDPTRYLNIWVCAFPNSSSTLAFATIPSDLSAYPELDGVVARHEVFGTTGTAGTNGFDWNDKGRTVTHEVGHWLNLEHIWGDAFCGNDFVSDTPPQEEDNYECPTFPHNANNACGSDGNGEMFMNYMDYTDDECMNTFTQGQATRMWAAIDGVRSAIKSSTGCGPVGVAETAQASVRTYPNPATDQLWVEAGYNAQIAALKLTDITGRTVAQQDDLSTTGRVSADVSRLPAGIYTLSLNAGEEILVQRVIISR